MIRRDGDKEIPEPFADEVIVICNNCQCFFNCVKTPVIRIFVLCILIEGNCLETEKQVA